MPVPMSREIPSKLPKSVLEVRRRAPLIAELATLPLLLTACETTTSQKFYIVPVDMKNIANSPYSDLGESALNLGSQYNLTLGNPETLIGFSGGTDCLISPVMNRDNGLKIATYKNSSGQIENKTLIPKSGTYADSGINFLAYYTLSDNMSADILAGKPVAVKNSDLGPGLYGLTLRQGLTTEQFQKAINGVKTVDEARQIWRQYVATFFMADAKDIGNQNKFQTVELSGQNDQLINNLVGLLTGARPVSAAEPSKTPAITTPAPATPTATKASTPTEKPSPTPDQTRVTSDVYTFSDFETRDITFDELPFIDYEALKADDLSTSIQVGDKVMEKAITPKILKDYVNPGRLNMTYIPIMKYITNPETRFLQVLRAFRTEVNGKQLPGAIIGVKNSDGSTTKLKVLFSSEFSKPANVKYLNGQLKNGPATNWELMVLSSGGLYTELTPMDFNGNSINLTSGEFYVTPAELETVKNLMDVWQKTRNCPQELSKFLLYPLPDLYPPS